MRRNICLSFLLFLLTVISCNDSVKERDANQDTSIHYFFDTTESLGMEVIVDYRNGIPIGSGILIQEEMKRTYIGYHFLNDSILAQQIVSYYHSPLSTRNNLNINGIFGGYEDSVSFQNYIMRYDGTVIWQEDSFIAINNLFPKIEPLLTPLSMI